MKEMTKDSLWTLLSTMEVQQEAVADPKDEVGRNRSR